MRPRARKIREIQERRRRSDLLAADHLKKHPLKMMSTLTVALNHLKEEEEELEERNSTKKH